MTQTPAQNITSKRDIDPNVLQNKASTPENSVWVGASAGSGKTKVLTDRILRLLLPDINGENATPPHKILALTFTKAGASEMSLRVQKCLSQWAIIDDTALFKELKSLLGDAPTTVQTESARKLFAQIVDVPGGLKIMTIHSFCQSILGRFPLEADLTPNFKALEEEQSTALLNQAQSNIFQNKNDGALNEAIENLALIQNEEQFDAILKNLTSERRQVSKVLQQFTIEDLYQKICDEFGIEAGKNIHDLISEMCHSNSFNESGLWDACKVLSTGTKTDIKRGDDIQKWLERYHAQRSINFTSYALAFLKQDGNIRKTLLTKALGQNNPDVADILSKESLRLYDATQTIKAIETATITRDLFTLGSAILDEYNALKSKQNALDFDDLIIRTLDLLQGNTNNLNGLNVTPWVRYKLDQGIDHILVDEAQDTNPEQWEIVQALCGDFFDGDNAHDIERTVFVVGDQKQSIFSFQRASPEKFNEMYNWFEGKIKQAEKNFNRVNFIVSFRSVPPILELVDAIYSDPAIAQGVEDQLIEHQSFRAKQAGLVELWPIFETDKEEPADPWEPPITIKSTNSGASKMADHIGDTIQGWIGKEELDSHNRKIQAGDIMILVRSRTAFIDQLVRALKIRNIPVSGVDRMVLSEQLVVQDLCALAQFSLLPEDDLTLACVLKSPFIGWDEDRLLQACYNRGKNSLWQVIQKTDDEELINWLNNLILQSGKERPYEFISTLLQTPCPAHAQSGLQALKARLGDECLDPLNEFLNNAIAFEADNIATLQNFIHQQTHNEKQIKRQMEEAGGMVRIMTVHGSKGLQAPIVILPDTTKSASSGKPERILWPEKTGDDAPYFCPSSDTVPNKCATILDGLKQKQDEEHRRLLYVALTRAEDRLYVGGHIHKRKAPDNCWYRLIENGFDRLPNVTDETIDGITTRRYYKHATDKADKDKPSSDAAIKTAHQTPEWLFKKVTEEALPQRPLTPSRPDEEESAALSPLKSQDDYRFVRGNITHKLLQILPDITEDNRLQSAQQYVSHPSHNISNDMQDSIIKETMSVLNHDDFKDIFGPNSMAEVSVTGELSDGRVISGQIDRLLVTDDAVFIIDYKTNRPPPNNVKDVPNIYINQMRAYKDAMRKIYPKHQIKCALLWTDGTQLMELTDI